MTRLYRFYNMDLSRYGEPFALCDAHADTQKIPSNCDLQKIADKAVQACAKCSDTCEAEREDK